MEPGAKMYSEEIVALEADSTPTVHRRTSRRHRLPLPASVTEILGGSTRRSQWVAPDAAFTVEEVLQVAQNLNFAHLRATLCLALPS